MNQITYTPIGIIRSKHRDAGKTPIQPVLAKGCPGLVELLPEYAEGLRDLDGFSHAYLVYHLHRGDSVKMLVKPFLQDQERGGEAV